jgi:hypothetical protein
MVYENKDDWLIDWLIDLVLLIPVVLIVKYEFKKTNLVEVKLYNIAC